MTAKAFLTIGLALSSACHSAPDQPGDAAPPTNGSDAAPPVGGGDPDPNPRITFTQVGKTVGIDRASEPASAGTFTSSGTLAYGSWLARLHGHRRPHYYP